MPRLRKRRHEIRHSKQRKWAVSYGNCLIQLFRNAFPCNMLRCNPKRCVPPKLRGQDLNLRPRGYEPRELPDCSTPRYGPTWRPTVGAFRFRQTASTAGTQRTEPQPFNQTRSRSTDTLASLPRSVYGKRSTGGLLRPPSAPPLPLAEGTRLVNQSNRHVPMGCQWRIGGSNP